MVALRCSTPVPFPANGNVLPPADTTSSMHVLLTGATGAVGVELVPELLARDEIRTLRCLVRGERAASRLRDALCRAGYASCALDPRLRVVYGDLVEPGLGVSAGQRRQMREEVTHVLHGAASIRFDASKDETFRINVDGTRRLLDLFGGIDRRLRFGYLSTLFVVGRRTGNIPEGASPNEQGFLNPYEASKWAAEELVRDATHDISVYRLPLLLGRARDGYVHHYLEAHLLLEAFTRGWFPQFPADASSSLPLMPTEVAAREVLSLFFRSSTERLHALAPGDALIDFRGLFELLQEALQRGGIDVPSSPTFVSEEHLEDEGFATLLLETTREYLRLRRTFDASEHRRRLGPAPCPRAWLPNVLRHCVESDWGRRVSQTPR